MKLLGKIVDATVDGMAIAGAGLIAYGAWLVAPPAGFIVGGLILFGGAAVRARAEAAARRSK